MEKFFPLPPPPVPPGGTLPTPLELLTSLEKLKADVGRAKASGKLTATGMALLNDRKLSLALVGIEVVLRLILEPDEKVLDD